MVYNKDEPKCYEFKTLYCRDTLDKIDRQEPSKEDKNQLISRFLKHKDANVRQLAARILNSTKDKPNKNSESASFDFADNNEIGSNDLNLQQEYQDEEKYTKDATPRDKTGDGYEETSNDEALQKVDEIQHSDVIDETFHGTTSEAWRLEEEKALDKNLQRKLLDKEISYTKKDNNLKEHEQTESQESLLENRAFQAENKPTNKITTDTKEMDKNKQNIIDEHTKIKQLDKNNIQSPENENKHVIKEIANQRSSGQNKSHGMTQKKQSVNLVENNEEAHLLKEEKQGLTSTEQTNSMSTKEEEKDFPNKIGSLDPKPTSQKFYKTTTEEATEEIQQKDNELLGNIDEDDKKELKSEALAEEQEVDAGKHTKDQSISNFIEQNGEGNEFKENDRTLNRKGDEDDIKETSDKVFTAENLEKEDNEEDTGKNSKNNPKEESPNLKENLRLQEEDRQQSVSRKPTTKLTILVSTEKDIELLKEDDLNTNKNSGDIPFKNIDKDKVKDTKIDLKFDSQHEGTEPTAKARTNSVAITSVIMNQTSLLSTKITNPVLSSSTKESLLTNKVTTTVTNSKAIQTSSVQTSTEAVFISRIHDDTARVVESEQKKKTCLPDR